MRILQPLILGALFFIVISGFALADDEPKLPRPDSDTPPKNCFIFADNFHFFYASPLDKRFDHRAHDLLAVKPPEVSNPDYSKVYLAARAGQLPAAAAKAPFLLMGWLSGGGHPSPTSYRVIEASIKDRRINCELQFTYHVNPNAGPGIGRVCYFAAEMPALPRGDYTIRFQVVKSYFDRGDGLLRVETKRDVLEDTTWVSGMAEFSIIGGRSVSTHLRHTFCDHASNHLAKWH